MSKQTLISLMVCLAALGIVLILYFTPVKYILYNPVLKPALFEIQAVDTMKNSRDMARQMKGNATFDKMIDDQMQLVAELGATHVAIATPYDDEFVSVLRRWVTSARAHGLKVWFRGNFSGWEGWFNYPRMSRPQHELLLAKFIEANSDLFQSGDAFSPCPECENGGPGDPRMTGDAAGYNNFLIDEYNISKQAFISLDLDIDIFVSMNADIARQIITPRVAKELGGTILIDHYVQDASQVARDVEVIAEKLEARVGLGEFGAPIPDLNGYLSQEQQEVYVRKLLDGLYNASHDLPVVNYWVLEGGSTAIADTHSVPRLAYSALKDYFSAPFVAGIIFNTLGERVDEASVKVASTTRSVTSNRGIYQVFLPSPYDTITITAEGYLPKTIVFEKPVTSTSTMNIYLEPLDRSLWYKIKELLYGKNN